MTKTKENRILGNLKLDLEYYRNMMNLFEHISTQRKIPKEIIIPVYDYLYSLGVTDMDLDLLFQICFDLAQKIGIGSLEDLREWFEQGHVIEVDEHEIRFLLQDGNN